MYDTSWLLAPVIILSVTALLFVFLLIHEPRKKMKTKLVTIIVIVITTVLSACHLYGIYKEPEIRTYTGVYLGKVKSKRVWRYIFQDRDGQQKYLRHSPAVSEQFSRNYPRLGRMYTVYYVAGNGGIVQIELFSDP